jgi:hypothetical protein
MGACRLCKVSLDRLAFPPLINLLSYKIILRLTKTMENLYFISLHIKNDKKMARFDEVEGRNEERVLNFMRTS